MKPTRRNGRYIPSPAAVAFASNQHRKNRSFVGKINLKINSVRTFNRTVPKHGRVVPLYEYFLLVFDKKKKKKIHGSITRKTLRTADIFYLSNSNRTNEINEFQTRNAKFIIFLLPVSISKFRVNYYDMC